MKRSKTKSKRGLVQDAGPVSKKHKPATGKGGKGKDKEQHDSESTEGTSSQLAGSEETGRVSSAGWKSWGPFLSERQWGTVREDYSKDGNCWEYFPHEAATYRAYQWGEDGLLGWCDSQAHLCLSLALWNGKDPMLKERLFGLTGPQGNHGEDVKECYYYLASTPTHSYTKMLYKYPQTEYPYQRLLEENSQRTRLDTELELTDTGVFDRGYWDVFAECAKASPTDMLFKYSVHNRSKQKADIHILPQIWLRNTWSWHHDDIGQKQKPSLHMTEAGVLTYTSTLLGGSFNFAVEKEPGGRTPTFLFTENDTNEAKLTSKASKSSDQHCYKDAFHEYVVKGNKSAVNKAMNGTKAAVYLKYSVPAGKSVTVRCRLYKEDSEMATLFGSKFSDIMNTRYQECQRFYQQLVPTQLSQEEQNIAKQAYAGLCFTKQFYHYFVGQWLKDRPHKAVCNKDWAHMCNADVISMPDKWEFPWYATWDLAFHMVPFANIDPEFAKQQLLLLLSNRYMNPNGQLPAYEFNFGDVNPPVHAWACLKVYQTAAMSQLPDVSFLKAAFHKLLLNFNWWVNKKDREGKHIYSGGFLGMDNVTCVNRSKPPDGATVDQVDGTCWMAFYSMCMLQMALELSKFDEIYVDMAIKFLDHFRLISNAINNEEIGLWDSKDGFYYDQLSYEDKTHVVKCRSLVGLTALFPACVLDTETYHKLTASPHQPLESSKKKKVPTATLR